MIRASGTWLPMALEHRPVPARAGCRRNPPADLRTLQDAVALRKQAGRSPARARLSAPGYHPAGPMRARLAISDQNVRIWLARNPCQWAVLRRIRARRTSMYW